MSKHSKRSVLAAESLVFTRGSSGVYFEALLEDEFHEQESEGKILAMRTVRAPWGTC